MLGPALALSILLHAALIESLTRLAPSALRSPRPDAAALDVRLREVQKPRAPEPAAPPAMAAPVAPRLVLPRESQAHASAAPKQLPPVPRDKVPQGLAGEAARSAHAQLSRALLYPREAIEQGIEGEATVLLFLDEAGNAIAARLEASSGYALLDDAAVRASRRRAARGAAAGSLPAALDQ